jgi:uncharacterized protein YicC (UPF0701 family)
MNKGTIKQFRERVKHLASRADLLEEIERLRFALREANRLIEIGSLQTAQVTIYKALKKPPRRK